MSAKRARRQASSPIDAGPLFSNVGRLRDVLLVPVRHHSPRSSAALSALFDRVRPAHVLIEGPRDATPLIDALTDPGTVPPVAILAYRTHGEVGSSLWPFASYSPEYVAAKWAATNGASVEFIDWPAGVALASHDDEANDARGPDVNALSAEALGHRSFEEMWEASLEAPAYDPEAFSRVILAYADLVRAAGLSASHRARDAVMASHVLAKITAGVAPGSIAVVAGAAHVAAFAAGDVDLARAASLPEPVPCALTLVPYSFPRLSTAIGYGAGNRAPRYYQLSHEAGCSYTEASLRVFIELGDQLRLRGMSASLADTLEAYRLARSLASLRDKAEPGLDEVREAAVATLCRGDATHVDELLRASVVGSSTGRLAARSGKSSLEAELRRELDARRLPQSDEVVAFTLNLTNEVEVGTSVLLHRLRVAGVPYASFVGRRSRAWTTGDLVEAGGAGALERRSEAWEAWLTPATWVALIEKIPLGDTIEEVASRTLEDALGGAHGAGDAAAVLLEAVVAEAPRVVGAALAACDKFAVTDDDLPSLARSASALSALASHGSSRASGDDAIPTLFTRIFTRAVLRLADACGAAEDAIEPVKEALRALYEVALSQPLADKAGFFAQAHAIAEADDLAASASGMAAGLLALAGEIDDAALATLVSRRLSDAWAPARAASFLSGLVDVNALAIVKSRAVVAAIDGFLTNVPVDAFRDLLPALRRAFASLGPTERRSLIEHVLGARRIGEASREAERVLLAHDREVLASMGGEMDALLHDLDELL